MTPTITVDSLSKTYQVYRKPPGLLGSLKGIFHREYEDKLAVQNVSFLLEESELVGFIGPNGAGKTTTLKMLSGLLHPTAGKTRVLGFDPWQREHAFLKQISLVMGQKNQLWWDLPAIESFRLAKDIYGISDKQYKKTLSSLVEMLDISDKLDIQVRKLSLGERMKAELVAALLHQPKVLFLDEPTIGLDVVVQRSVRKFIKEYNSEFSGSILLTSHYMADVQELCKRVIIINEGEILFDGLLADVVKEFGKGKQIQVTLTKDVSFKELKKYSGFVNKTGLSASFQVSSPSATALATRLLTKLPVSDINIKEPELEDVIRDVFSDNKK